MSLCGHARRRSAARRSAAARVGAPAKTTCCDAVALAKHSRVECGPFVQVQQQTNENPNSRAKHNNKDMRACMCQSYVRAQGNSNSNRNRDAERERHKGRTSSYRSQHRTVHIQEIKAQTKTSRCAATSTRNLGHHRQKYLCGGRGERGTFGLFGTMASVSVSVALMEWTTKAYHAIEPAVECARATAEQCAPTDGAQ